MYFGPASDLVVISCLDRTFVKAPQHVRTDTSACLTGTATLQVTGDEPDPTFTVGAQRAIQTGREGERGEALDLK